ncbi:MAG TPA: hypothetical protein VK673_22020 [Chthoniobacterales bacterium]|nr:hypothetical protein [Chthoniobacterales bacterium]
MSLVSFHGVTNAILMFCPLTTIWVDVSVTIVRFKPVITTRSRGTGVDVAAQAAAHKLKSNNILFMEVVLVYWNGPSSRLPDLQTVRRYRGRVDR